MNRIISRSGTISQSKTQSLSNLEQERNGGSRGKAGRGRKTVPRSLCSFCILKSFRDFKDNSKKRIAWEDVARQVGLQTNTSMYVNSGYSFICLMFSNLKTFYLRIKSNSKSSNILSSPGSAILNVYK